MTLMDDMAAERAWNSECSRPGKPPISRKHYAFQQGLVAYHAGCHECPHLAGGNAWRHWYAGWHEAANAEHCKV